MTGGVDFVVEARSGSARAGRLQTAHGEVETPAFMPVGTAATVKAMSPEALAEAGTRILLANTYHLMLRPGSERIARQGGLHRFMNWSGPILTDSGGFQVMSLAGLRRIEEEGVTFRSHLDGSSHRLTPERCIEIQRHLGTDIAMVLDECTAYPVEEAEAADSMRLSLRWAARSRAAFAPASGLGLFGIVQGGVFHDLRAESAEALVAMDFDGYALGGLAVGEGQVEMFDVVDVTMARLPVDRPRYLMGVGKPLDMVGAIERGIDLFDCVLPTRSGRTGQAFTRQGAVNLRNARHQDDARPLDEACGCPACQSYSRAYLHHLVRAREILGAMLLTQHNLHYYQELIRTLRTAIAAGKLEECASELRRGLVADDIPPC